MSWLSFLRQAPYAAAPDGEADCLERSGSPGEMLSLAVALCSEDGSVEVEVSVSELRAEGGRAIPAAAVDAHVVKVWQQAGIGIEQDAPLQVPELLLKDDGVALRDRWRRGCGHWRHVHHRSGRFYEPPDLRLHGRVRTTLRPQEAKQIWLSIRLPPAAAPGRYSGYLEVAALAPALPAQRWPVAIDVLPLELTRPRQALFLFYKGTLDCRRPRHFVSAAKMRAQLRDIRAHGFRIVSLNEADPALLQRALDIAWEEGFRERVVLFEPFPADPKAIDYRGVTPLYYLSDKLDVRDATAIAAHVRNWQTAAAHGVETICALQQQVFAPRLLDGGDIGHVTDEIAYFLPHNLPFIALQAKRARAARPRTLYYWHAHMEKPLLHRILAGAYLWKSEVDGIAPYCYQDLPVAPSSPFDDFDEWDPEQRYGSLRSLKHHMATYPARDGSIPTLQWKGMSDGLHDLMYMATLDDLMHTARTRGGSAMALAAEVRRDVDAFLARVSLTRIEVLSPTEARPYPDLDGTDLDAWRATMARGAVEIRAML